MDSGSLLRRYCGRSWTSVVEIFVTAICYAFLVQRFACWIQSIDVIAVHLGITGSAE